MIERILSGGQTGVDRGALDAALDAGFPCGGWCPRGRRAEDGRIPGRYPLEETASPRYVERTRRNVRDSDATLVLAWGEPSGGTRRTVAFAERMAKPCLVLDMSRLGDEEAASRAGAWIVAERVGALNVAGPRARSRPDAEDRARRVVALILTESATPRRS
ncbi:MAG: putative molybdenum carrier protein [Defluviicoccus sp.]|nr:putative molybdenum carrier protein [Defluviicoccus sp.]MDE0386066.1 putative molybdenum carrier protein [Defluviicoccus sp.]